MTKSPYYTNRILNAEKYLEYQLYDSDGEEPSHVVLGKNDCFL